VPERIAEPATRLPLLLSAWQIRPRRNLHWLQDLNEAFQEREGATYARYVRVSSLAVEIARLLSLPPSSRAAIRASAFLVALREVAAESTSAARKATGAVRAWQEETGRWRWIQACLPIVRALRSAVDSGRVPPWRGKEPPIESRVLAVAEDFDKLTSGESGSTRTPEALHALRASSGQRLDARLVELLWSEAGQAVCNNFLRRRDVLQEAAEAHLEESLRLLEQEQAAAVPPARYDRSASGAHITKAVPRGEKSHTEEAPSRKAPRPEGRRGDEEASPQEDSGDDETHHEHAPAQEAAATRRDDMTRAGAKEEEEERAAPPQDKMASEKSALTAHLAALVRDLEEIRSTADRSLEALASITPAMEEFSQLVPQLQRSLLSFQNGGSAETPAEKEPAQSRTLALRVERSQGPLDLEEVTNALDNIRDLTELQVQDHGPSWAILRAQSCPDVDLSLLEAKVTGSLTRHLGAPEASVEVTFLPAA
jgi:hypothetical protein